MKFVEKIAGPDERVIGIGSVHWIYGLQGLLWLAGCMGLGIFLNQGFSSILGHDGDSPIPVIILEPGALNSPGSWMFLISTGIGAIFFLFYVVMMYATEIGLTSKRIIYKRGWIFVKVVEVDLEEIKSVNVNNGIFGRILNYGYLRLDARFIKDISFSAVADPYRYVKAMNDARSAIEKDTMKSVLGANAHAAVAAVGGAEDGKAKKKSAAKKQKKAPKKKTAAAPSPPDMQDEQYDALQPDVVAATEELLHETQDIFGGIAQESRAKKSKATKKKPNSEPQAVIFKDEDRRERELHDEVLEDFDESSAGKSKKA
jgi:hypothetical protein